jgi:hypothetical protein
MLKIWLTWLQPSLGLGVLGTALVLTNPFYADAATKPVRNTTKVPTQLTTWSIAKSTGTRIDRELSAGVAITPDLAVRQLAIDSMVTPGIQPTHSISKTRQASTTTLPARVQKHSTKPSKATQSQLAKNSTAAEIARALQPQGLTPVPGIYIGNSNNVSTAKNTVVKIAPVASATSAAVEIGAPTPLSAMMGAKPTVNPFPVVRPEMMQQIQQAAAKKAPAATTASVPTVKKAPATVTAPTVKTAAKAVPHAAVVHSLDPIATIPTVQPKAKAKAVNLKATAPNSLDPIAAIPSGLQKLLGNNLNSGSTVAKAVNNQPKALLALKQFVSPTVATVPPSVTAASLRLATAQAYTSVPAFSIPGEPLLVTKAVKSTANLLVANKRERQDLTTTVVGRKSNYVARLTPVKKQSWTVVNQRNNLGGLILGSQPLSTVTKSVDLVPNNTLKASASIQAPASDAVDFN